MPAQGRAPFRDILFENGVRILTGARATRQGVANDFPDAPIGSIYIQNVATGSTGRVYVKVTHTGAAVNTDWQKITTSAAD